ncbi:MAG: hypothetical protein IPJ90_15300 [Anaerolineaceae bacterium]|nr:hypothetical protein [Anaerolineaceae bacterium]
MASGDNGRSPPLAYASLIMFVLLPAGLMLLWVWANDAQQQNRFQNSPQLSGPAAACLPFLSAPAGFAVVVVIACRIILL